ncbi:LPS export ABC transporter periplasmic protein LptC [Comamonas sp. GB3 AK4-5]|uniref:LPS export ABC transporter periplasmic protein LptC n=1 Tax=Comamonas sp. GB3 AK4-5 TaxID=3231487 RepID=UPI00351DEB15
MMAAVRRSWEQVSLYLPVLLMALLALGSWWLVRNAPTVSRPVAERPVLHEPDYTMLHFMVKDFDAKGRMQSEIRGDRGDHYPDTDTMEIQQVDLRGFAPDGTKTTATARKGISNSDASEVQLWGNAVVVRQPLPPRTALKFEGEFLHAWTQEERVRSHLPVVLTRGEDRFTSDKLEYDNVSQVVQMQGRVRGSLQPGRVAP